MTLKLYGTRGLGCTARVMVTLFEKDVIDFEVVGVDLLKGEHKKSEIKAMQPFGKVPVLIDGPLTLFESRAIARYISHKYETQGTPLYGSTPMDKALVEQWLEVEGQNYDLPMSTIVTEIAVKPLYGAPTNQAVVDENVAKLEKVLDVYEAHLADSKYLAGDFFSLADLSHIPWTQHLVDFTDKGDIINKRVHVKAWWEDISSRPAWKEVGKFAAASPAKTGFEVSLARKLAAASLAKPGVEVSISS